MRKPINKIIFDFDRECPDCGFNQNSDDETDESSMQCRITNILESGHPTCQECGAELYIQNTCEVE